MKNKFDLMSESDQAYSLHKALTLVEALPYIRKHTGKIVVVKYGGHVMENKKLLENFSKDICLLKEVGIKPIVVHGGGPQINEILKKRKIKSNFVNGLRITDNATIKVVKDILINKINKEIVKNINNIGGKAISLSGNKNKLIIVKKIKIYEKSNNKKNKKLLDIGFVGEPYKINNNLINKYLKKNYIPVIAPLGLIGEQIYNINADTVAGAIAGSIKSSKLLLLTDIAGIKNEHNKLIQSIHLKEARKLIKKDFIKDGMKPKIETCIKALNLGVKEATIMDGRIPHALILELFTIVGIGTQLKK